MIMGLLGLLASFSLTYDLIRIGQNPNYEPSCSINPIISCTSVMETPEATVIGEIPNSMFGIIGFSMLILFGLLLAIDVILPRKMWQAAQLAGVGGIVFAHYLIFSSVFALHTICPWCFLTWLVTIATFWAITTHNAQHGLILRGKNFIDFRHMWQRNSIAILVLWYGMLFALLLVEFWEYWRTLL
jgi:uncharacterized membrane protein